MRRIHRAIRRDGGGGAIIPAVFPSLAARQVFLRRSEVSLVAATPGAGKSTFALVTALHAKVPTLYVSADTSAHTQALRLLSAITGKSQQEVEPLMESNPDWVAATLRLADHIHFSFDSAPSLKDLEEELEAFQEAEGIPPQLVVIDNLSDVVADNQDVWESLRSLMRDFKFWARERDAAFLVLHHTSEAAKGEPCPPRSAIHGKVSVVPALVLTVAQVDGFMAIATVKNRFGPANPSGTDALYLQYDPAAMSLRDVEAA